jgi:CubicO group peptidase (beta-lactamase class C family)
MVHGRALVSLLAAVAVTLGACGGGKQTSPADRAPRQAHVAPELAGKLQRALDQQRTFFKLPGAAAAVVIPGKGVWSGGSGIADRESGAPVTASTTFAYALGLGQIFSARLSGYLWGAQGDFSGFGSTLVYQPANGITAAVLANRDESMPATLAIAEGLIETATEGH